ncbi:transposase [Rhodobacter calidifons]|uniref:IS110 family transposase n=1 Tax=Rhodobacter calidifons TaxID=2715277 RepID=A0ABX0GAI6_9RHOB|nr:transposase [Rhodobacter calidifons]NHB78320.1 IS110 family transposase [Rhodobacter calidifons]
MPKLYVGLDVSLETTSVCAVDEDGVIRLETKAISDSVTIVAALAKLDGVFERIGLEAGPLEALLRARAAIRKELAALQAELLRVTQNDELCRRFMTIPGVGPVTAQAFKTTIDRPDRFRRSADVGAHLGLAPRQHQSGETDQRGRITRSGDAFTRSALYTAAHVMLTRSTQWTALKTWGVKIAKRSSLKKARVAVARKLAVVMHRMWRDETQFRWTAEA